MPEKRFGLSRDERVRKGADFDRVFREGDRMAAGLVYVRFIDNGTQATRLGVAVPARFGKAAKRNRARRLLKESFRLHKHEFPRGLDVILLPGRDWNEPALHELEESLRKVAGWLSQRQQHEERHD